MTPRRIWAACTVLLLLAPKPMRAQTRDRVLMQFVGVSVPPAEGAQFEADLAALVEYGLEAGVDRDLFWLTYRQGLFTYRLVVLALASESLASFDTYLDAFRGLAEDRPELLASLRRSSLRITSQSTTEFVREWSTVEGMSTATNPKALVTEYGVRLGSLAELDRVLTDFKDFYLAIDYPYPVEAFKPLYFSPGRYMVVVFPDAWDAFDGPNDIDRLAARAGRTEELESLRARLNAVILDSSTFRLDYAHELSFNR